MVRTLTLTTLTACALLALVPAGAGAHRFNAATTAAVESGGPDGAEGTVSSSKAACRRNRLVELFRVDDLGGEPQSFGTDLTDRNGNWRVDASRFAGEYYVTVSKRTVSLASHKRGKKRRNHGGCRSTRSARRRL